LHLLGRGLPPRLQLGELELAQLVVARNPELSTEAQRRVDLARLAMEVLRESGQLGASSSRQNRSWPSYSAWSSASTLLARQGTPGVASSRSLARLSGPTEGARF
jgi:hypothetical protein